MNEGLNVRSRRQFALFIAGVEDGSAEGVALQQGFFGDGARGMGDDDGVVVLFFKGLGGGFQFVDIGF